MKEKHAIYTIETAYELGIGNHEYELIDITSKLSKYDRLKFVILF